MRLILAILIPWFQFFTIGKPIAGIICLLLQITVIGWIPAVIWSVYALSQYKTEQKIKTALKGAAMSQKIISLVMVLMMSFAITPAHAGGIPVFDAANLTQQIKSSAEELFQLIEQVTTLKQQYDQLQQTYKAITGMRNLGDIMNNPLLKEYIPNDWKNVYDSVKSGGYQGLTGAGQAVRDANKVFDICAAMTNPVEKQACNRQANKAAQDMAFSTQAFDKTKDRLTQIESLMKKVGETEDEKEALEMIGRVQAESAMIQNEMTRLQLFQMLAAAEEKLAKQQRNEIAAEQWSRKTVSQHEPVFQNKGTGGGL